MRRLLATALSLAIVPIAAPAAGAHTKGGHANGGNATLSGTFQTLPAGTALGLDISGSAKLKLSRHGTVVKVVVRGLVPGRTYAAHLHSGACSDANPGGVHYKNDPAGPSAPPNELWLSSTEDPTAGITANEEGVARGRGSADWVAKSNTLSVVIHNIPAGGNTAGGPKIACADLLTAQRDDGDDSGNGQDGDDG
jgi:hypothetical protein